MFGDLFDVSGVLAHGYCLPLKPGVIALHVVSDAMVALAYFVIPVTLVYFVRLSRYRMSFSWAIAGGRRLGRSCRARPPGCRCRCR